MGELTREDRDFLAGVASYVAKNPAVTAHVVDAAHSGVSAALSEVRQRAADMETVASVLASRRYKGADELVIQKLTKWRDKASLNWSWLLDRTTERR